MALPATHNALLLYERWQGFLYVPHCLDTVGHATAFGKPVVDHWSGSRLIQITLSLYYLHQPWYKSHFRYTTYTSRGTNHTFVILLTPAVKRCISSLPNAYTILRSYHLTSSSFVIGSRNLSMRNYLLNYMLHINT